MAGGGEGGGVDPALLILRGAALSAATSILQVVATLQSDLPVCTVGTSPTVLASARETPQLLFALVSTLCHPNVHDITGWSLLHSCDTPIADNVHDEGSLFHDGLPGTAVPSCDFRALAI